MHSIKKGLSSNNLFDNIFVCIIYFVCIWTTIISWWKVIWFYSVLVQSAMIFKEPIGYILVAIIESVWVNTIVFISSP